MLILRRTSRLVIVALLAALTPTAAYECMQKGSELLLSPRQARHGYFRLSIRAEEETRWRPRTGYVLVDHALHEWAETRRFYTLARRQLDRPPGFD